MNDLEKVFGDYTPGEIAGATRALRWTAQELANANNLTKNQTTALTEMKKTVEDLQTFFKTAEANGFSALRDSKLDTIKTDVVDRLKVEIRRVVKEEVGIPWGKLLAIIGSLAVIIGAIVQIIVFFIGKG